MYHLVSIHTAYLCLKRYIATFLIFMCSTDLCTYAFMFVDRSVTIKVVIIHNIDVHLPQNNHLGQS